MGNKSSAPPPPDYTPIANASKEAAELSYKLGEKSQAWAEKTYAENKTVTDKVVDSFLTTMDENRATALKDRARYEREYQPLEDKAVKEAADYATPERKDLEMGRAQAGVAQQFEGARDSATRNLEAYGIDPSSTRYAALDVGMRAQQAAASAAAGNQASQQVDATGRALRSEAINVGRGYPGQIAGQYSTSMQGGSGGANAALAQTASGASTMGTNAQYMGLANNSLGTWGNALNMGYQNQLGAYNAEQNSSSGVGSVLGLAGAAAMKFMADGGDVTPGGAIPAGASPTRGQEVDDVAARLTVGEFVMPKDVTSWLGEKAMHSMIEKARKEQQELPQRSGAIPAVGRAPIQEPTFSSRPGGALPTG